MKSRNFTFCKQTIRKILRTFGIIKSRSMLEMIDSSKWEFAKISNPETNDLQDNSKSEENKDRIL